MWWKVRGISQFIKAFLPRRCYGYDDCSSVGEEDNTEGPLTSEVEEISSQYSLTPTASPPKASIPGSNEEKIQLVGNWDNVNRELFAQPFTPPQIKRSIASLDDEDLVVEPFPSPSWQGVISDEVFLHYDDMERSAREEITRITLRSSSSFSRSMESQIESFDTTMDECSFGDDDTVTTSNAKRRDSIDSPAQTPKKEKRTVHESLQEVFDIKISEPIELPKNQNQKSWSFRNLGRHRSAQSGESLTSTNVARSTRSTPDRESSRLFLKDAQEDILMGTLLQSDQLLKKSSPIKFPTPFKRERKAKGKCSDPAKALDTLMNKTKSHRRSGSDSMQKIQTILKGKAVPPSMGLEVMVENWSEMDDAIKGRLDGVDVIACGSARSVSYIGSKQKNLAGQRYTLRKMVLDTLHSSSGKNPPEIILEGFTQRGEGRDRWAVRIEKRCSSAAKDNPTHLWGIGNESPPTMNINEVFDATGRNCKSTQPVTPLSEDKIFVIGSLDQLQKVHEFAVDPLKNGDVEESISLFKKILRSLRNILDATNHIVGSTYHNIALLTMWEGHLEEALTFMNKAVAIRAHALGVNHSSVAVSLAKIGMIYFGLERLDSSLRAMNQALDIRRKINSQDHAEVAKLLNNIALIHFHQGEKKLALKYLIEALQIQKRWTEGSLCRQNMLYDSSITLSNIAKVYLTRQEYTMAAYLYEEALHLQAAIFRKNHDICLQTLSNIAFSKVMAGEATNAMQIYKSLYKLQSVKFGIESREVAETKGLMSVVHIQMGHHSVALRCLSDLLKWQQTNLDRHHPAIQNTKSSMEKLNSAVMGDCILLADI